MTVINVWAADVLLIIALITGYMSFQKEQDHKNALRRTSEFSIGLATLLLAAVPGVDSKLSSDKSIIIYSIAILFAGISTFISAYNEQGTNMFFGLCTMITLSIGINMKYIEIME